MKASQALKKLLNRLNNFFIDDIRSRKRGLKLGGKSR